MEAMLSSMTAKERARPDIINAKRKIRVAKGSGTTVQEINKLLKMHQEMATVMKRLKKMGGLGKLAAMFGGGGAGGRAWRPRRCRARCRRASGLGGGGAALPGLAARPSTSHQVSTNFQRNRTRLRKEYIMAVAIRLSRGGSKKRPYYRIVVADSRNAA